MSKSKSRAHHWVINAHADSRGQLRDKLYKFEGRVVSDVAAS
jgi:hypothetical protein